MKRAINAIVLILCMGLTGDKYAGIDALAIMIWFGVHCSKPFAITPRGKWFRDLATYMGLGFIVLASGGLLSMYCHVSGNWSAVVTLGTFILIGEKDKLVRLLRPQAIHTGVRSHVLLEAKRIEKAA